MSYLNKLFNRSKLLKEQEKSLSNVLKIININYLHFVQEFYSLENSTDIFYIFDQNKIAILMECISKLHDEESFYELSNFLYRRDNLYSMWINGHIDVNVSVIREISERNRVKQFVSFFDSIIILHENGDIFYVSDNNNQELKLFCKKSNIEKICSSSNYLLFLSKEGNIFLFSRIISFISVPDNLEKITDIACTNSSIAFLSESGKVTAINDIKSSESISDKIVKLICSDSNIVAVRDDSSFEIYIDYESRARIFQKFTEYNHQTISIFCGTLFTICLTESRKYRLINIKRDIEFTYHEPISKICANGTNFMILTQTGKLSITNILDMKKTSFPLKQFDDISCGENGNNIAISSQQVYFLTNTLRLITYERNTFPVNSRSESITDLLSENIDKIFSSKNCNLITTSGSKMFLLLDGERKIF